MQKSHDDALFCRDLSSNYPPGKKLLPTLGRFQYELRAKTQWRLISASERRLRVCPRNHNPSFTYRQLLYLDRLAEVLALPRALMGVIETKTAAGFVFIINQMQVPVKNKPSRIF